MRARIAAGLTSLMALGTSAPAYAYSFDLFGISGSTKTELSEGVSVRTEAADTRLIGKLNVPGQSNLCPDGCTSFTGDAAPNQRLVDAPGAFFGSNKDNGDMNYHQWGVVAANSKISQDLTLSKGEFTLKVGALAFYDPANYTKDDIHNDTHYQPPKTARDQAVANELGKAWALKDAFIAAHLQPYDHPLNITVGYQHIRWGESNFIALNSLSQINAPNSLLLHQPNTPISEVFQPTPALLINTPLNENISVDLVYELGWQRVVPDPDGSFNSSIDVIRGSYANESLGNYSEDPNGLQRLPFPGSLFSNTSLTAKVLPYNYADPNPNGQGGIKLSWYLADFNGGTELDFYALNYHSQLPYVSAISTNNSCARDATNFGEAYVDCYGFKLNPQGGEPLPLDTAQAFLDYPRNIQMYGVSFNTNVGAWSLAGEYSFRPNLPVQVQVPDVLFAALQPAFPKQDIPVNLATVARYLPGAILQEPGAFFGSDPQKIAEFTGYLLQNPTLTTTIPGSRTAVPDYYEGYTGITVGPNQVVHGYVRLPVDQFQITAIRVLGNSDNPIGADQVQFLVETGFTHVWNFPDRSKLQLEGGDNNDTHASPGVDGTGSGGVTNSLRQNPTQQTHGFASAFAWGYRMLIRMEYDNLFWGINVRPQILWSQDVSGIAVQPMQNFVEGTKTYMLGSIFEYGNRWSGQVFYQGSTGGGTVNTQRDRDILGMSVSYTF